MKGKREMPEHLSHMTKRDWQQLKRQQVKELKRNLSLLMGGIFYTPIGKEFHEVHKLVDAMESKLSVKNWKSLRGKT